MAWIDVAADDMRTFRAVTRDMQVSTFDSAFDLSQDASLLNVSLGRGIAEVLIAGNSEPVSPQLGAGDWLTLDLRSQLIEHGHRPVEIAGAWQNSVLCWRNNPVSLPARLELARTLFDDGQEREAENTFASTLADIDVGDAKTAGVRKSIGLFRDALEQRQAWSGAVAVGPEWTDNVNRTSASQTCLAASWFLSSLAAIRYTVSHPR